MSESSADLSLAAALRVVAPLIELLLHQGVTYPRFANALKKTFLEAAASVLEENAARVNDSSLSTLSGIHRKDVREWRTVGQPRPQIRTFGAVMEVFTRWANDPAYCDQYGCPMALDRFGETLSFETLAASVSRDVRPHTLLQELIRLGVARRELGSSPESGDKISLCGEAFVPKEGSAEMLQLLADNVGDHLAAAAHNLKVGTTPMLEQSVYADNLSPESVTALSNLTRQIWSNAFHDLVRDATGLCDKDREQAGAQQRVRVGMYFYHGPNQQP